MNFKGDLENLVDINIVTNYLSDFYHGQEPLIKYLCSLYESTERRTRNLLLGIDDEFTTSNEVYSLTGIRSIIKKEETIILVGSSNMLFRLPTLINVSFVKSSYYLYSFLVDSVGDLGFDSLCSTYQQVDLVTYFDSFSVDYPPNVLCYTFDFNYLLLSNIEFIDSNLILEFLKKNLNAFHFSYYINANTQLELLISFISDVSNFNFKDYPLDLILGYFNIPLKSFESLNNLFKSLVVHINDETYCNIMETYHNFYSLNTSNYSALLEKYLELFNYCLSNNIKFKFSDSISKDLDLYHKLFMLKV